VHRIVFPLEENLYGRSISASAPPHRLLPGVKGGLYAWEQVRRCPEVSLVEGLFDYAVLWQAGFHNVTCLAFDSDRNGSGQLAARSLAEFPHLKKQFWGRHLWARGISAAALGT
jgi:hypothetical protein